MAEQSFKITSNIKGSEGLADVKIVVDASTESNPLNVKLYLTPTEDYANPLQTRGLNALNEIRSILENAMRRAGIILPEVIGSDKSIVTAEHPNFLRKGGEIGSYKSLIKPKDLETKISNLKSILSKSPDIRIGVFKPKEEEEIVPLQPVEASPTGEPHQEVKKDLATQAYIKALGKSPEKKLQTAMKLINGGIKKDGTINELQIRNILSKQDISNADQTNFISVLKHFISAAAPSQQDTIPQAHVFLSEKFENLNKVRGVDEAIRKRIDQRFDKKEYTTEMKENLASQCKTLINSYLGLSEDKRNKDSLAQAFDNAAREVFPNRSAGRYQRFSTEMMNLTNNIIQKIAQQARS